MAQDNTLEVVTVTGFRGSLEKALDLKRNSAGSVDSIMAEDIAKFPDLNLSESLQRVPGVAITRDAGEGRQISVRGLGGSFTRTLINGMEVLTTAGGTDASGGTNRTRTFDFNVFASDLFNQLSIEKTASAETEEGSLGSTVLLYTAHPLDISGFKFAASAKGEYNDLAHTVTPRFGALISDTFFGGKVGVLISAAYANRDLLDEGTSTVRWAGALQPVGNGFRSVSGVTDGGTALTTADFNAVAANTIFHPRIPRFDKYIDKQHRTGLTGSLQFQPDDETLFTLDALYSDFGGTRDEEFLESFTFQQSGACTGTSPPLCGINQVDIVGGTVIAPRSGLRELVAGTFNNVDLKAEHRHDKLSTQLEQITLTGSHDFGSTIHVKGMIGYNNSMFANSIQTDAFFDQYNVQGYKYDYSTEFPLISYGTGAITTPTSWALTEIREAPNWVYNRTTQANLNAVWDITKGFKFKIGINWVEYKNRAVTFNRSNGTSSNINTTLPATVPALSTIGMVANFNLPGMPSGNATQWFIPDLDAASSALHLYDPTFQSAVTSTGTTKWVSPFATTCFTAGTGCGIYNLGPEPVLGSNYTVQENNLGGYVEVEFDTEIAGLPVRGNLGSRLVQTKQSSLGYGILTTTVSGTTVQTITPSTYTRTYTDVLPAINLVAEPIEDLLFRLSAAKVVSRPTLSQLNPGITLSVAGNRTATAGNPAIEPFRANTVDMAVEWYFGKGGLISVAGFYKDVSTFVQNYTSAVGPFSANPWGLPDSQADAACGGQAGCSAAANIWTFSYPLNTPGGPVKGVEINYQQPFTFLPGPFDKMGFIGNLTLVDSKIKYMTASGGNLVVATVNQLTNLSGRSWNATLYYEDDTISTRVSAAYRSKYLTTVPGRNGSDVEGTNSTLNIDASFTYNIDQNWAATLEGVNLTNELQDQYFDSSNMMSFKHMTGREVLFGIRFNY